MKACTLKRKSQQGTTILLVEQIVRLALKIANRAYVMQTGEIVLSDPAHELTANEQIRKAYLAGQIHQKYRIIMAVSSFDCSIIVYTGLSRNCELLITLPSPSAVSKPWDLKLPRISAEFQAVLQIWLLSHTPVVEISPARCAVYSGQRELVIVL